MFACVCVWRTSPTRYMHGRGSYKPVSDATVQQCCDVDWDCSKLSKFIKEPGEQRAVKAVVQRHYRAVMQVFKQVCTRAYACVCVCLRRGIIGHVLQASALDHTAFSLSMNTFTDFFKECKVPDRETCKLQELDTIFIASNVVSSSTKGRRRSLLPARSAVCGDGAGALLCGHPVCTALTPMSCGTVHTGEVPILGSASARCESQVHS